MARPTPTQLTTAGFSQAGTTTRYTKSNTTAVASCDTGSGAVGIAPVTPGVQMAQADFAAHVALLTQLGVIDPSLHNVPQTTAGGLQAYGIST